MRAATFLAKNLAKDFHSNPAAAKRGIDEDVAAKNHSKGWKDGFACAPNQLVSEICGIQVNGIHPFGRWNHDPPKYRWADALIGVEASRINAQILDDGIALNTAKQFCRKVFHYSAGTNSVCAIKLISGILYHRSADAANLWESH